MAPSGRFDPSPRQMEGQDQSKQPSLLSASDPLFAGNGPMPDLDSDFAFPECFDLESSRASDGATTTGQPWSLHSDVSSSMPKDAAAPEESTLPPEATPPPIPFDELVRTLFDDELVRTLFDDEREEGLPPCSQSFDSEAAGGVAVGSPSDTCWSLGEEFWGHASGDNCSGLVTDGETKAGSPVNAAASGAMSDASSEVKGYKQKHPLGHTATQSHYFTSPGEEGARSQHKKAALAAVETAPFKLQMQHSALAGSNGSDASAGLAGSAGSAGWASGQHPSKPRTTFTTLPTSSTLPGCSGFVAPRHQLSQTLATHLPQLSQPRAEAQAPGSTTHPLQGLLGSGSSHFGHLPMLAMSPMWLDRGVPFEGFSCFPSMHMGSWCLPPPPYASVPMAGQARVQGSFIPAPHPFLATPAEMLHPMVNTTAGVLPLMKTMKELSEDPSSHNFLPSHTHFPSPAPTTISTSNNEGAFPAEGHMHDGDNFEVVKAKDVPTGLSSGSGESGEYKSFSNDGADDDCNFVMVQLTSDEIMADYRHFCPVCGKGFKREPNMMVHLRGHGKEFRTAINATLKPKIEMEQKEKKRFSCPVQGCRRNQHHSDFRPLKTLVCMKNHFKRTHGHKKYGCSKCGKKTFSVLSDLKTHEKHCGLHDEWACTCGNVFTRKDKLLRHVSMFDGHSAIMKYD